MRNLIKKNLRRAKTVVEREISFYSLQPREVNLELTHRCNLRCKMCGVWMKEKNHQDMELSAQEYSEMFIQMKDMGVKLVTLAGGEPFIRKDLFKIVEAAKSQELICNVFTNGTLIDRDAIEKIFHSKADKVIVSIDGNGLVHDKIRGVPGSFDKATRALTGIVAEQRNRGVVKPELDMHMTILKENVADIFKLFTWCRDLGVNFSFQPYSESNQQAITESLIEHEKIGSKRYLPHNETLRSSDDNIRVMREEIERLPVNFYTKLLGSFSDEDLKFGLMSIKKCYITRNFMMIDPYGNAFPCTNLDGYLLGNIRELRLREIWRGEKYRILREKLSQKLLPVCRYCCHCSDNLTLAQLVKIILRNKFIPA